MKIMGNHKYSMPIDYMNCPSNLPANLCFEGRDLFHAIMTCGVMNPLAIPSAEFKFKRFVLECQFDVGNGDELYLSHHYAAFDPTEKVTLSYYRGMVFGKLLSEKIFKLTYFINLSSFTRITKIPVEYRTRRRPDTIAWNRNMQDQYTVWECKGNRDGIRKGIDQTRAIGTINGRPVHRAVVSAVYPYAKKHGQICACIYDPESEGRRIELNIDSALEYYYRPVIQLMEQSLAHVISDNEHMYFSIVELEDEKLKIGLPRSIFEYFTQKQDSRKLFQDIVEEHTLDLLGEDENMYNDYIYIKCL